MVKRLIKLISVVIALSVSHFEAYAQSSAQFDRDIWLVNVTTPNTLDKGHVEIDLIGRYINFSSPDPRTEVADFIILGSYGLTRKVNLGFASPFSWISENPNNFGEKDLGFFIRYLLWDGVKFKIAFNPYLSFPTGSKGNLRGSGEINYNFNLNLGFQQHRIGFFTNLGFGKTEYVKANNSAKQSSGTFAEIVGAEVGNEKVLTFSGGIALDVLPSITLTLEGIGQVVPEISDEDFYFQIGGIIRIKNKLLLRGSGGLGLPRSAQTITDALVTTGVSYLLR